MTQQNKGQSDEVNKQQDNLVKYNRELLKSIEAPPPKCELCNDTGYYGDQGPGIKGNDECNRCECRDNQPPTSRKELGDGGREMTDDIRSYEEHEARLFRSLSPKLTKAMRDDTLLWNCFNVAVKQGLSPHKMLTLMTEKLYEKSSDRDQRLLDIAMKTKAPPIMVVPNNKQIKPKGESE